MLDNVLHSLKALLPWKTFLWFTCINKWKHFKITLYATRPPEHFATQCEKPANRKRMFSSRSCVLVFALIRCINICAEYADLAHQPPCYVIHNMFPTVAKESSIS
jgi:hypothetical protein